jgi:hypothetical protein
MLRRLRKETPFVLLERTGGAFSEPVAALRYRYWAAAIIAGSPHRSAARPLPALAPVPIEPFRHRRYLSKNVLKGTFMTQADHYRDQSNRARRLARAVRDPEASKKLIEMAEQFRLYAERLEQTAH